MYTSPSFPLPATLPGASHHPGTPMCFGPFTITETQSFPPPAQPHCWVYVTLNAEIALSLPRNPALQGLLQSGRARVSVDGQWIWWALRRKYAGRPLYKLSGSDLIHTLAGHCAAEGRRLFLLGSCAGANAQAVQRLRRCWPALAVEGLALPHFQAGQDGERAAHAQAVAALHTHRPDYVVLGLGPTKQYPFAARLAGELDGRVTGVLCFGGAIDMASGQVARAPRAWQQLGLEGLYRVLQQPARMGRLLGVLRILPRLALGRY
jgi:exopolysaccharide biosynthesis WecB/TagA/CpsF family protein